MDDPKVVLTPAAYIARFRKRRRLLNQREIPDLELLDALRFLRAEMIAREISPSFKPKGRAFIAKCISWLKNDQYKPSRGKKNPYYVVPRNKLELYPDEK